MFGISGTELFIIIVFVLVIFGPDKLPQIGRTVGQFMREFKRAQESMEAIIRAEVYASDNKPSPGDTADDDAEIFEDSTDGESAAEGTDGEGAAGPAKSPFDNVAPEPETEAPELETVAPEPLTAAPEAETIDEEDEV